MNNLFRGKRKVAPGQSRLCQKCANFVDQSCTKPDADVYETGIQEAGTAMCSRLIWNEYWMNEYFGEEGVEKPDRQPV
jgi:hypothetical protein